MNDRLRSFSRKTKVCDFTLSVSLSLLTAEGMMRIVRVWIDISTFFRIGDAAEILWMVYWWISVSSSSESWC